MLNTRRPPQTRYVDPDRDVYWSAACERRSTLLNTCQTEGGQKPVDSKPHQSTLALKTDYRRRVLDRFGNVHRGSTANAPIRANVQTTDDDC